MCGGAEETTADPTAYGRRHHRGEHEETMGTQADTGARATATVIHTLLTAFGYGLVALGGAVLNDPSLAWLAVLGTTGTGPAPAWVGWFAVAVGLLLTRVRFRPTVGGIPIAGGSISLPAPLATLPEGAVPALVFVVRTVALAFMLRWAVGGILFWAALPFLALSDCRVSGTTDRARLLEALLLYLLFFGYGAGGVWNFVGHFFMADTVAASVGWAPGSPFQQELAFYALGTGIVGLMTPWWRGGFWLAAATATSVFVYGAAFTHIQDYLVRGNTAPANWGVAAVGANLVIPTAVLLLTWLYWRALPPAQHHLAQRSPRYP